jgi:hypothetical protein
VKLETYWLRFVCGRWVLKRGRRIWRFVGRTKAYCEARSRAYCRKNWEQGAIPTRLNICDLEGQVIKEASYGADSKRRKG